MKEITIAIGFLLVAVLFVPAKSPSPEGQMADMLSVMNSLLSQLQKSLQ